MPYLNIVNNVFEKDLKNVFCKSRTVNGMLNESRTKPEGPFIVMQGRTPILRKDWDIEQNEQSSFTLVVVPAGMETAAIFVLTMISSYLITSYLVAKALPSETQRVVSPKVGPAVFTFDGQQNIKRLNEPVECAYGRNRWYPSYQCAPYVTYVNNQAFLRAWFSLGNGDFDIEDVYIGENRLNSFPGSQWAYLPTGSGPNTFADHIPFFLSMGDLGGLFDVVLSPKDLAGVELKAPNEENYAEVGYYAVCGHNDVLSHLQFNFSFPQGCFGDGPLERTVEVKLSWYKESGQYQGAFYEETVSFTYATYNPQKISIRKQLFADISPSWSTIPGQWQVKVQRLTTIPEGFSGRDQVVLESVTGLGGGNTVYKTSGLYVALQGSDRMVTDAASKVNLVATRKLPVFNGLTWDTLPTRHPIWAAVDVLRSDYGAQQTDGRFDLPHFKDIADKYPLVTFDHVFNQKTTIHDAMRSILRVLRGTPYTAGSDYRVAIDSPYDMPVAFFGPDNAYDMNWSMVLRQELDNDAVTVSYVDPDTGLEADVQFTPHDSLGINPKKVSVVGLTSREAAWRMAAYIYMSEVLQRDLIEFYTGLDGFIPVLGDLISVSWPFPAWGQAGVVVSHDNGTLTCSEILQAVTGQAWVVLRSAFGGVLGPYKCSIGTNPNEIVVDEPLPTTIDFDCLGKDPVMYAFGSSSTLNRLFRVTMSEPSETNVRITASTYDPAVFSYDLRTVPVDDKEPYPLAEGEVSWIIVEENTDKLLRMSWASSDAPYGYRVRYTWDPTMPSPNTSDIPHRNASVWYPNYCDTTNDFETADVFGTSAYLRRDIGELFIELACLDINGNPVEEQTRVWRAEFADFGQEAGVNKAIVLKFQTGTPDGYYQVSELLPEYGVAISRDTKILKFYTDMPAGAGTKLQLTLYLASSVLTPVVGETIEFLFPDTGYLEITPEMLEEKGWQLGFAAQRSAYMTTKLVNIDLSELRIPVTIAPEDWSGYTNNTIKFAKSTYGQLDISNYPGFTSHSGVVTKLYIGLSTKLMQPDGREDFEQYWNPAYDIGSDFDFGSLVVGSQTGVTTRTDKRHRYSVFGRLNAKCKGAYAVTGSVYSHRIVSDNPYFWDDPAWIVPGGGGLTPYEIMTGVGFGTRRYVKFFVPMGDNDAYEQEINQGTLYCVQGPETYLTGQSWYIGKTTKTPGDPVIPFDAGELEAIENARMVFIEWEYPTGLNIIRQRVNLSTMWGSQTGFNPPPPVATAYSKEIEVTTSCP